MTGKVTVEEIEGLNNAESRSSYEAVLKLLVRDQLPLIMKKFGRSIKEVKEGTERLHFLFTDGFQAREFVEYMENKGLPAWLAGSSVRVEIKYLVVLQNDKRRMTKMRL